MNIDEKDLALQPVTLLSEPGEKYDAALRRFQGVPTLERSMGGRLWAAFYGGGTCEGSENYVLVLT
ncbi:MAG: hypothetical protein K0Q59_5651, partial [Paenibacillus sp.]|nr:hypothetical protein [Paenibacillus sp.]